MTVTGSLKLWDRARGYGFITRDDGGADVFLHSKQIARSGMNSPSVGDRLSFDLMIAGNSQVQACALRRISEEG
ncbi:cold shock domain-containing protein [Bradyrhizobium sp. 23]|nr:cold shock domain-containing protein [Bradyrhizobium sp. 23]